MEPSNRLNKILFHLGKGIWKGIPIVGPIVEEVIYEANKDSLLQKVDDRCASLSEEDLESLDQALQRIENSSEAAATEVQTQLSQIEKSIQAVATHVRDDLSTIMSVVTSLRQVQSEATSDEARRGIQVQIVAMEMQREAWKERLSQNQVDLLACIPSAKQSAERRPAIFDIAAKNVPKLRKARYEEMNFRLHELRWLDLIARESRQVEGLNRDSDWFYWRTHDGSKFLVKTKSD